MNITCSYDDVADVFAVICTGYRDLVWVVLSILLNLQHAFTIQNFLWRNLGSQESMKV